MGRARCRPAARPRRPRSAVASDRPSLGSRSPARLKEVWLARARPIGHGDLSRHAGRDNRRARVDKPHAETRSVYKCRPVRSPRTVRQTPRREALRATERREGGLSGECSGPAPLSPPLSPCFHLFFEGDSNSRYASRRSAALCAVVGTFANRRRVSCGYPCPSVGLFLRGRAGRFGFAEIETLNRSPAESSARPNRAAGRCA